MSKDAKDVKEANPVYHFAFTYNCPDGVDEKAFRAQRVQLCTALKSRGKYIFQLEKGHDNGRYHYQGYLHAKVKVRPAQLAVALQKDGFKGLHVSISHDKDACKKYSMKKDTRVDGPWDDRDEDWDNVKTIDEKTMYPWQQEVVRQIRQEPDDRKVCWLVDQKGCAGKTALAIWLRKNKLATPMPYSDSKDANYMVTSVEYQRAYVFDLTRVKPASLSATDLYATLENIKNGLLHNTKYQAKAGILRPNAHVWVFANHVPDYKSLSQDRWMVYEIDENRHLVGFDTPRFRRESRKRALIAQVHEAVAKKRRAADDKLVEQLAKDDLALPELSKAVEDYLLEQDGPLPHNPNALC